MVTWQLTVDCHDPTLLSRFWAEALGYVPQPPPDGYDSWVSYYRFRGVPEEELAEIDETDNDRLMDPAGEGPTIWFQPVPETKTIKNRIHFDVYPGGRDRSAPVAERRPVVEARVAELTALGATMIRRYPESFDAAIDEHLFVTMGDPEGNEFCVS